LIKIIVFCVVIFNLTIFAQMGELEIMPHHINFMDQFQRIKTVRMFNYSQSDIRIDSISYDPSMLYVRNNDFDSFPVTLTPNTHISIDVLLVNYFTLQGSDSLSTISVYNTGRQPVEYINVNVNFEMHHGMDGIIRGSVRDSSNLLSAAKLYFFYEGIYLIDSTTTDNNGNYEKELRSGYYFISAIKDGYYMQYGELKNSPLEADYIEVSENNPKTVDFLLEAEVETDLSVSGVVYDIVTDVILNNSVVVLRKGKHNPTKIQASIQTDPDRSYSVMTNSKGEFNIKNIQVIGDYYLEAFSQYYLPGYFNHMNNHEVFWQNADSVSIFGFETGKNIYLDRDSSYGGGMVSGYVEYNNNTPDSADGALVYAVSTTNNKVYNYNFSQLSGQFGLPNLPYGSYELVSDKIGFDNAVSNDFIISTDQDTVQNIVLILVPTSVDNIVETVTEFNLAQNYPNPFNPATVIRYNIPVAALSSVEVQHVTLKVYDILGKEVATLINKEQAPGTYEVKFDASQLSSGIYFYQLTSGEFKETKKMLMLK